MTTPTIETDRILLRPLKISDAEAVFKKWANDPGVTKYMRWNTHQTINETIEWLTFEEKNIASGDSYSWGFVYKENDELFGSGGMIHNKDIRMFEIGYVLMEKYWNMGLATEAAKAFIDFAVKELKQTSFFAVHAKENPASGKVMEKLGFIYDKDGSFTSFDGKRTFECRDYILSVSEQPRKDDA
ncbi:MAG: GNAT family N-acetyltransferase [Oscillospiraceae bacterium]|nr:GNAT family N-acetyltransferase [Oscillospiraceae bacterium]